MFSRLSILFVRMGSGNAHLRMPILFLPMPKVRGIQKWRTLMNCIAGSRFDAIPNFV
jgi:uncharacterized ion transporter superfamily protein YfcC